MEKLRLDIISKLNGTTGESIDYDDIPSTIKTVFDAYDELGFINQISQKLKETNSHLSFDGYLISELPVIRWCDILFMIHTEGVDYDMSLTPWAVARLTQSNKEERLNIFGTQNMDVCLLILFEHQLSHLLALLWGHFDINNVSDTIYGVHGKLYKCATSSFFGDGISNIPKHLEDPLNAPLAILNDITVKYSYWENSCNLDSLNMLLFTCKNSFFRSALLTTNSSSAVYDQNTTFRSPCTKGSEILTEESFRNFVSRAQEALIKDYSKIASDSPSSMKCVDIRSVLSECFLDMKIVTTIESDNSIFNEPGTVSESEIIEWDFYNVGELYALYTDMFPVLKLRNTSVIKHNLKNNTIIQTISAHNHSVLTFWDFLHDDDPRDIEGAKVVEVINWNKVNHPFLVFKNGGIPAITKFGVSGIETIKNPYSDEDISLTKHRNFGETILNGKYEMIGAIILEGTSPGEEGGVHYHACINTHKGWFYYDDSKGPMWKHLKQFPSIILTEKKGRKPEMYFYGRVR